MINISYKDTIFKGANLTPIRGEPPPQNAPQYSKQYQGKRQVRLLQSHGRKHGHLGLVLTDAQFMFISTTPFIYPNQPGLLIIPDGTTTHANSNMRIAHTKEVCLFREVTVLEQDLVQQIFATAEAGYLAHIRNWKMNFINDTIGDVLTYLQEK